MGSLAVLLGSFYLALAKMISQHWENQVVHSVAKFRKMFPNLVLYLVTCAELHFLVILVQFQPVSLPLKVGFQIQEGCVYDGQLLNCCHVLIRCNTYFLFQGKMNFVPAPNLHKDHHYVLKNTSCSLLVTHVPLMDCTTEGKLIYFGGQVLQLLLLVIVPCFNTVSPAPFWSKVVFGVL